jgi:hypothetical protein
MSNALLSFEEMTALSTRLRAIKAELASHYVCGKCGGRGTIEVYHWNQSGTCFQCSGTGRHACKSLARKFRALSSESFEIESRLGAHNKAVDESGVGLPDISDLDLFAP